MCIRWVRFFVSLFKENQNSEPEHLAEAETVNIVFAHNIMLESSECTLLRKCHVFHVMYCSIRSSSVSCKITENDHNISCIKPTVRILSLTNTTKSIFNAVNWNAVKLSWWITRYSSCKGQVLILSVTWHTSPPQASGSSLFPTLQWLVYPILFLYHSGDDPGVTGCAQTRSTSVRYSTDTE